MMNVGVAFCPAVLSQAQLAPWVSRIDAQYERIEAARGQVSATGISDLIPPGQRFAPTASSFTIGTILTDEELQTLFTAIDAARTGAWIRSTMSNGIAYDLTQSWVRRQYAPHRYPPLHAPHGWHQDGALGFDFLSHPGGRFPADALLPMVTCWIALGPCGVEAPGLEIVTHRLETLFAPCELVEEKVRARFGPKEFYRPAIEAGDAVLLRGDILHRTLVKPEMMQDRTSIELRFFAAENLPVRLKGDRFVVFSEKGSVRA